MLHETRIRAAKPAEKPYKLFDEPGLFMLVTPSGGRLWRLRYRQGGVEKLLTLGAYPDVSLKRARAKREDARKLVLRSCSPFYVGSTHAVHMTLLTARAPSVRGCFDMQWRPVARNATAQSICVAHCLR